MKGKAVQRLSSMIWGALDLGCPFRVALNLGRETRL